MTAQGVWRFAAALFGALGVFSAIVYARMPWRSGDADATGFVWTAQNLPKLAALLFLVVFFSIALWCWVRSFGRLR